MFKIRSNVHLPSYLPSDAGGVLTCAFTTTTNQILQNFLGFA